jgi:hypothetical protein
MASWNSVIFNIVRGGSPESPRETPAVGAFTRHFCAAGQETRRANTLS